MHKTISTLITLILMLAGAMLSHAADMQSSVSNNMKAIFSADARASLIDLRVVDAKTGIDIKDAKVKAAVTTPANAKITIDLPGMTMDKTWSYMNSFDMTEPGTYSFVITVERKGRAGTEFKFKSIVGK